MTVLLVEDDADLRRALTRGLRGEGFFVVEVGTGAGALRVADEAIPDAIVMDIGLPDADGRDVCQALRARGIDAPVLFLSARDALADRLSGFSSGGDDYVVKPFAFSEFVARLRALLRRSTFTTVPLHSGLQVDPAAHRVTFDGVDVRVTPTEFRLLAKLLAAPAALVTRDELVTAGWSHGAHVKENSLDAYIARIRRKLEACPGAPSIATVHGLGYRLE